MYVLNDHQMKLMQYIHVNLKDLMTTHYDNCVNDENFLVNMYSTCLFPDLLKTSKNFWAADVFERASRVSLNLMHVWFCINLNAAYILVFASFSKNIASNMCL